MKIPPGSNTNILLVIWAFINGIIIYSNGIITEGEAVKYIYEAKALLDTGSLTASNYWFYFTQITLLVIAFKLKLGYAFVVIVQLFFSAWALLWFYRLAAGLFSKQTAFIGTLIFLLNYSYHEYNTYVQTESLFHSFTIIFTSYLLRLNRLTLLNAVIIFLSTVLICITRPTGLLLVPGIALYLFFAFFKAIGTRLKIGIVALCGVAFLVLMNAVIGSKGEWDFMLPYLDERIICGVPTLHHFVDIKTDPNGDSIYGLYYYIVHNFDQFIRMAFLRSKAFFGLLRTYYGRGHNTYLAVFFYPLYAAALLSLGWWWKHHANRLLYFSCAVSMTWVTTLLTCDDWHNRWFLTISPWIIMAALPAITKLFTIFTPHGDKRYIQQ
jgi:hypothetical protein